MIRGTYKIRLHSAALLAASLTCLGLSAQTYTTNTSDPGTRILVGRVPSSSIQLSVRVFKPIPEETSGARFLDQSFSQAQVQLPDGKKALGTFFRVGGSLYIKVATNGSFQVLGTAPSQYRFYKVGAIGPDHQIVFNTTLGLAVNKGDERTPAGLELSGVTDAPSSNPIYNPKASIGDIVKLVQAIGRELAARAPSFSDREMIDAAAGVLSSCQYSQEKRQQVLNHAGEIRKLSVLWSYLDGGLGLREEYGQNSPGADEGYASHLRFLSRDREAIQACLDPNPNKVAALNKRTDQETQSRHLNESSRALIEEVKRLNQDLGAPPKTVYEMEPELQESLDNAELTAAFKALKQSTAEVEAMLNGSSKDLERHASDEETKPQPKPTH